MTGITNDQPYNKRIENIGEILEQGRKKAIQAVNTILVETYWMIGKSIVEYEKANKDTAGYSSKLFEKIAGDLRNTHGRGFSRSNVIHMRLLYLKYPKGQTLSDQLSRA